MSVAWVQPKKMVMAKLQTSRRSRVVPQMLSTLARWDHLLISRSDWSKRYRCISICVYIHISSYIHIYIYTSTCTKMDISINLYPSGPGCLGQSSSKIQCFKIAAWLERPARSRSKYRSIKYTYIFLFVIIHVLNLYIYIYI